MPSLRPVALLAAAAAVTPIPLSRAAPAPAREAIAALPPMRIARMAHTATTLRDARVLVAGGFTNASRAAVSAELFDPATGRFAPVTRMLTLRHSHTATLLPDGKVLLVGGYADGNTVTASAELYDPSTQRFLPTGPMGSARAGHVAVALQDGRVLIAGGVGPDWTFRSSAEVYDPATGSFTATGGMSVARESHAAVRLVDGRVLIVGGHRDRRENITLYASAETYDPVRGGFTPVGAMAIRRHKHDAVLLADGRVLVTGGSDERDDQGAYRSTELFDPARNTFSAGPLMSTSRYKHAGNSVLLPDGTVLLAGGARTAERYDPRLNRFSPVAGGDLSGQFSAAASISGGGVLITGGYGHDRGPQAAAWRYQP